MQAKLPQRHTKIPAITQHTISNQPTITVKLLLARAGKETCID